jgi:hypothetical protein
LFVIATSTSGSVKTIDINPSVEAAERKKIASHFLATFGPISTNLFSAEQSEGAGGADRRR